MEGLIIKISWEYFLGIFAGLIVIAWYTGRKFSNTETSIESLKTLFTTLRTDIENIKQGAYAKKSPISLTEDGKKWLNESGLKQYIDSHRDGLLEKCKDRADSTAYQMQKYIFSVFDTLIFEEPFYKQLQDYAFNNGLSIEILRRVGAIYFRDICLSNFNIDKTGLDEKKDEEE